jgi:hypothetical protein
MIDRARSSAYGNDTSSHAQMMAQEFNHLLLCSNRYAAVQVSQHVCKILSANPDPFPSPSEQRHELFVCLSRLEKRGADVFLEDTKCCIWPRGLLKSAVWGRNMGTCRRLGILGEFGHIYKCTPFLDTQGYQVQRLK